ncbi:MAG: hypothetical protein ATN35_01800 [Epulopiscium sp. Nele67-Bin004]|nr:MAG: hypothetical protein ATN35_01800 [Epulopiscium sp. Nele67-Bin004]
MKVDLIYERLENITNSNGEDIFSVEPKTVNCRVAFYKKLARLTKRDLGLLISEYNTAGDKDGKLLIKDLNKFDNPALQLLVCSYAYKVNQLPIYLEFIIELIKQEKYNLLSSHNIYKQIRSKFLLNGQSMSVVYKERYYVWESICRRFLNELDQSKYLAYTEKSNTVVVTVGQLLDHKHSPTQITLQICRDFVASGKKVVLVVTGDVLIAEPGFIGGNQGNYRKELEKINALNLGDNVIITIYHARTDLWGLESLIYMVDYIYSFKPEFVYQMGDGSMVADVCSLFTNVITQTFSIETPITLGKGIVTLADEIDKEEKEFFEKQGHKIIPGNIATKILNSKEHNSPKIRKDFGISEDKFLVAITGKDLNNELSEDYLTKLQKFMSENPKMHIAFIDLVGTFEYEKTLQNFSVILENSTFIMLEGKFINTVSMCDLLLNPPREGIGGASAIYVNVPIVTFGNCQLAKNVGEDFICATEEEYFNTLKMCIDDKEFYQMKVQQCKNWPRKKPKKDFGIAEEKFVIAIVGNRLYAELKPDYLNSLQQIIKRNPKMHIAFIGDFPYEAMVQNYPIILENSTYLGYQKELKDTLKMCDLFLNPPRRGGGIGAVWAIEVNVPVVTLGNCDVALNIGQDFVCKDDKEYFEVVTKYMEDEEFYQMKVEQCRQFRLAKINSHHKDQFKVYIEQIQKILEE